MMLEQMKKLKFAFLSFFLSLCFLFFYLFIYQIHYQDLFTGDLGEQYLAFFYYLKDVFSGTESIFFSFSKGLGESMLGTTLYYLMSPFNLFLFFLSKSQISLFIIILIGFKIGLAAFTMHCFLKKIYQIDGLFISIFAITYALMGYTIHYYSHVMWLDLLYLAPLVLLGIHKILDGKKSTFYIVFLFLSMISNFYIAYMLCLFSLLYFFYQIFLQDIPYKRKIFKKFIFASFFAALLSSFVLLPALGELKEVYRNNASFSLFGNISENLAFFLRGFFIHDTLSTFSYWYPNIYCTIFNLVLFVFYFGNKNIPKRDRQITFLFSFILFLSYIFPFLSYVWHGFSIPIAFHYRFSFLVTLFMITVSTKSFLFFQQRPKWKLFLLSISLFAILVIVNIFTNSKISIPVLFINFFFLLSYVLLVSIVTNYKHFIYKITLLFIIFIELFIYMKINFVSRKSLQYPYTLYNEKYHLCEKIGTGFDYRIDGYVINENENLICKKGKLSEFNTMNQKRKFNFFGKNGFWVESSSLSSFGSYPPLMSSLFGVRYLYTNEPISYGYEFLNDFSIEKDTYFVYENPNALSLGFAFDEHTYQTPIEKNPFLYQNSFVQYLTGNSIFSPVSYEKIDKKTFKIKIDYSFPIYLYYDGRYDLDIFIDNEKIDTHKEIKNTGYIKQGIVYVGNKFEKGEVIIRFLENIDDKRFFLYYLNEEKYSNTISQLRQNPVHITSIKKNILKGNIDLDEGKDVLFTIPYSKHYTVLVDDKPVKVLQRYNLFLGFRVEKGFHTMEIVYQNKLVYIGVFISLICFFGSVVFSIYTKRGAKREK